MTDIESNKCADMNLREAISQLTEETIRISHQPWWHPFAMVAGLYGAAYLFLKLL